MQQCWCSLRMKLNCEGHLVCPLHVACSPLVCICDGSNAHCELTDYRMPPALHFKCDWGASIADFSREFEVLEIVVHQSKVKWGPPQRPEVAQRIDDEELKMYGCENEALVNVGPMEQGDIERRKVYMAALHKCADASDSINEQQWHKYTLCRMSCHHVERVAAVVRAEKKFSKDPADALVHRDILRLAFAGFTARNDNHKLMVDLYATASNEQQRHPLVPPQGLDKYFSMEWSNFYDEMCSAVSEAALKVAYYAQGLIRFLIPAYIFALGPIPDPALWGFKFSVCDVENLYNGRSTQDRLDCVIKSLDAKNCRGCTVTSSNPHILRRQMWNVAHSVHVLLWGLYHNDKALLHLFNTNSNLLVELDKMFDDELQGDQKSALLYMLKMRRAATAARECGCSSRAPWVRAEQLPSLSVCCADKHYFYHQQLLEGAQLTASEIEQQVRKNAQTWCDTQLLHAFKAHCMDRQQLVSSEANGSFTLQHQWEHLQNTFSGGKFGDFRIALTLGTNLATTDPRLAVGYDRTIHILAAWIRKLVLDVRVCHENVCKMETKYWRYTGGERAVITIPYGRNAIIMREVQPKRPNNCRIVDVGLNLTGWYRIDDDIQAGCTRICQLDHVPDVDSPQGRSYLPLRPFLVDAARKRGGVIVLHGFCDGNGAIHEVEIRVTLPTAEDGQFEDLEFSVRVDNEDVQRSTIITIINRTSEALRGEGQGPSMAFLRLGIQLKDAGLGIKPDHLVLESADCLGSALDGENDFAREGQAMNQELLSRAMQISPSMLTHLTNTHRGLQEFLRNHVGSQMECLMRLFQTDGARIIGLTSGDLAEATKILQEAMFTVIAMSIDDDSFVTQCDIIKTLGTMSALSIIHLKVLSPLSKDDIQKLVNFTRATSLRYIIEASTLSASFFDDVTITYCAVELAQRRTCPLSDNTDFGKLVLETSRRVLEAADDDLVRHMMAELREGSAWAIRQRSALVLSEAQRMALDGKPSSSSVVVIVVSGDHPLTTGLDDAGGNDAALIKDFGREPKQSTRIQEFRWGNPRKTIVAGVHTIDPRCAAFYDTEDEQSALTQPVVFRPDLVVIAETTDDAVAQILGCSTKDIKRTTNREVEKFVSVIRRSDAVTNKTCIPSFQGFIRILPICEYLSHWARVVLYLYYVVEVAVSGLKEVVALVTSVCNNIFCRTIWNSVRHDCNVPIEANPIFSTFHRAANTSLDDAVLSAVRDGHPLSEQRIRVWMRQHPTPAAIRQYIVHSEAPLMVFAVHPAVAIELLASTQADRAMEGAPAWVQRLAQCLASESVRHAISLPFMSAARWAATVGGGGSIAYGADLDNLSKSNVVVDVNESHTNAVGFLQTLFGLDSDRGLESQHRLKDFLTTSPALGGIAEMTAKEILTAERLGVFFVRVVMAADEGNALLLADRSVLLLVCWLRDVAQTHTPLAPGVEGLLQRLTPAAWVEVLIVATENATLKWQTMVECIAARAPTTEDLLDMLVWCNKRSHVSPLSHCVTTYLTFVSMSTQPPPHLTIDEDLMAANDDLIDTLVSMAKAGNFPLSKWPLCSLDSSPAASKFSSLTYRIFLRVVVSLLECERGLRPSLERFGEACEFVHRTTTSSSQRQAIDAIISHRGTEDPRVLKWVYATLWIAFPLAPEHITTSDADVLVKMSQYLADPKELQLRFSRIVKENCEHSSALALALIGWVEYVPFTILHALGSLSSQQARMWERRITVEPPKCYRILDPVMVPNKTYTPPYAVIVFHRPLPQEQRELLLKQINVVFAHRQTAGAYSVSTGISKDTVTANLEFLQHAFHTYGTCSSIPAHIFIGVKMIVLWFACFGECLATILAMYGSLGRDKRKSFHDFLDTHHDSNLKLPEEMPPVVVDVHLRRPIAHTRLMHMETVEGREYTREILTASLPKLDNEDWSFFATENLSPEEFVRRFASISASRYSHACNEFRSSIQPSAADNVDFTLVYANAVLQPCLSLLQIKRASLAKLYCQTVAEADMADSDRGALALIALSIRKPELVAGVIASSKPILKSVKDELLYYLQKSDQQLLCNAVRHAPASDNDCAIPSAKSFAVTLTKVISEARVQPKCRVEFPVQRSVSANIVAPGVPPSQVSIFNSVNSGCTAHDVDDSDASDGDEDSMCQHVSSELFQKQLSGRSIDVSHILTLEWDKDDARTFFLTLSVTPGAECYLVEHLKHLAISGSVQGKTVRNVFKNHGEAWNFCKSLGGPTSLVGNGFFLYRSKENLGGWRFFIGMSVDQFAPQSDQEHRFYVWHVAAYHFALCLPLPPALSRLLHVLCEAIYAQVWDAPTPPPPKEECHERKISRILQALVSSKGTTYDRVREIARPILAFVRLLLSAANRFRDSDSPAWKQNLKHFFEKTSDALAPPRIGCIYDAVIDVLAKVQDQPRDVNSKGTDPAWFVSSLEDIAISDGDVDIVRQPSSMQLLQRLFQGQLRDDILNCVRGLSSVKDSEFARNVLSEKTGCTELKHLETAMKPLQVDHIWTTLMKWKKHSFEQEALLVALATGNSNQSSDESEKVKQKTKDLLLAQEVAERVPKATTSRRHANTKHGEGVECGDHGAVELCCVHHMSEVSEGSLPCLLWRDHNPDGFTVETGEAVGYVMDEMFCYRTSRSELPPALGANISDEACSIALAQLNALMFQWVLTVIGSPLSVGWKAFFLHHTHVQSRRVPETAQQLIAYCIAQLCPQKKLRDQLLGALAFKPTSFCMRRDRRFGVIVTPTCNLQSAEWDSILDKVGPITLRSSMSDAEQYRAVVKCFSSQTTHVIIEGKSKVSDKLLKWLCEFTNRFPWRFVVLIQCEVIRNMPEGRDRVVDLNDSFMEPLRTQEVSFSTGALNIYRDARQQCISTLAGPRHSQRLRSWPNDIVRFIRGEGDYGRVVLLVSPPGAGKSMAISNLEITLSHDSLRPPRFVKFDCSGDALAQQALVSLLNNALLGVDLDKDNVVLVADEYHMLSRSKKAEFLKWAELKLGAIRIILIANRDDADDDLLNQQLRNVSSGATPRSIIWRVRVGSQKMLEALSTVQMKYPATTSKAVTFLSTIRTLISDDVVSLRMASETCSSPYKNSPLEWSLRAKLQPENAAFASRLLQSFDNVYDSLSGMSKADVVRKYNEAALEPVDFLVFTAMLPSLLLSREPPAHNDDVDTFLSFTEFVELTSAYHVHPAVRLASWVENIVAEVNSKQELPLQRGYDSTLIALKALSYVDHPSFFPIILETTTSADLSRCSTLVYPHTPTLEGIYEALARHEALGWSTIRRQWENDPITDVDAIVKIANPSIVAPETVLQHMSSQNLLSLLQREISRKSTATLQNLVLQHYPVAAIEKEGEFSSPYFWCLWVGTAQLPLEVESWKHHIKRFVPSPRSSKANDESHQKSQRSRFLMWVAANGRLTLGFRDCEQRSKVAARTMAQIAEECIVSGEGHSRIWRCDFIAPAASVQILGIQRAYAVVTHGSQRPHPSWPREMQLLARICCRESLSTIDEVDELLQFITLSNETPPRIVGAILQAVPAGALTFQLQATLLNLSVSVEEGHLSLEGHAEGITKNVGAELLLRQANKTAPLFSLQKNSAVGVFLQKFLDQQNELASE